MPIQLKFPIKSHKAEDLKPLYERFKQERPDLFAVWRDNVLSSSNRDYEPPAEVSRAIVDFLRNNAEYDSDAALTLGSWDFELLLYREMEHGGNVNSDLRLTFPRKSHEPNDLAALLKEFKRLNPEIMELWDKLSLADDFDPELYTPISRAVQKFLRARLDSESSVAIGGGYSDFGVLLYREKYHG